MGRPVGPMERIELFVSGLTSSGLDCPRIRSVNRVTASPALSHDQRSHTHLSAIYSFSRWEGHDRFLIHFGEFPLQDRPDKATGRISLPLEVIELGFEIDG